MYEGHFIKKILKKIIDQGFTNLVIYPYGENGLLVKQILQEYFSSVYYIIVDNQYCVYHKDIISFQELKRRYDESMHIILTIENDEINNQMYQEAMGFALRSNITNLLLVKKETIVPYVVSNPRFSFKQICPDIDLDAFMKRSPKRKKRKVRFISANFALWNSVESVCIAFKEDPDYEVQVIIIETPNQSLFARHLRNKGISYVLESEYSAQKDRPEIVIVDYFVMQLSANMRNNIRFFRFVIAISSVLIDYYGNQQELFQNYFITQYQFHPKYYIADTIIYNAMKEHPLIGDKFVELGNPKFDGIYKSLIEKVWDENNTKLKGRKIYAWITTHGVDHGRLSLFVTFDLYAKAILDFARKHIDIGLIIRLHPVLVHELLESGTWTYDEVECFKEYCRLSPNIVWDDTETYDNTLGIADAFIMDGFCGTICSALPTLKPICTLYRNDRNIKPVHMELVENYYQAYSNEDLVSFMEMVRNGEDSMYEKRKTASRKYIKSFYGDNGRKIKKFIEEKFGA